MFQKVCSPLISWESPSNLWQKLKKSMSTASARSRAPLPDSRPAPPGVSRSRSHEELRGEDEPPAQTTEWGPGWGWGCSHPPIRPITPTHLLSLPGQKPSTNSQPSHMPCRPYLGNPGLLIVTFFVISLPVMTLQPPWGPCS